MEPTLQSRGSSETLATCNSTRSVPPYFGRFPPRTARGKTSTSRTKLVTASERNPVDLIVPRVKIARDDERAGRILLPIYIQDRARKFTKNRGAAFAGGAIRHDLEHLRHGPVAAVSDDLPTGGIAGWSQHGGAPPYWLDRAALHFAGRGPAKTASLVRKKHIEIASLGAQLATRVAGRL